MNRQKTKSLKSFLISAVVLTAVIIWFAFSVINLNKSRAKLGAEQLETAIRRSAVSCYSIEGRYPPDIDYLCEHYGLAVDDSLYTVFYDAFGENLMPSIKVVVNGYE